MAAHHIRDKTRAQAEKPEPAHDSTMVVTTISNFFSRDSTHIEPIQREAPKEGNSYTPVIHSGNSPPCHPSFSYLYPAINVVIPQATVGFSLRTMTAFTSVLAPTAAVVPAAPVSTAATATALAVSPRLASFHRDPRRKALVFPNLRRYREGHARLVLLVAVERPTSPVATVAMGATFVRFAEFRLLFVVCTTVAIRWCREGLEGGECRTRPGRECAVLCEFPCC